MKNIFIERIILIGILTISLGLVLSCAGVMRDDSITDYSTSGFVTASCFQIIIKSQPDINARTLAEKRYSSLKLAKEQLISEGHRQLKGYIMSSPIPDHESKIARIEKEVDNYISKGYIVCEYHLEDASTVIVYRVCASDLKRDVDGFVSSLMRPSDKTR